MRIKRILFICSVQQILEEKISCPVVFEDCCSARIYRDQ